MQDRIDYYKKITFNHHFLTLASNINVKLDTQTKPFSLKCYDSLQATLTKQHVCIVSVSATYSLVMKNMQQDEQRKVLTLTLAQRSNNCGENFFASVLFIS